MLHRLLAVTLLLLTTLPAWAATDTGQRLHAIRSHGFLLAANVLVYFNPHDPSSTFDPQAHEAYRKNLGELDRLIGQATDQPALGEALHALQDALTQLEQQPQDSREHYPRWINPLLRAHGALDKAAAAAYAETASGDSAAGLLHRQSLDLGRLLLLYETHAFTNLGIFFMDFHEDSLRELDRQVASRHAALLEALPAAAEQLGRVWTDYSFVRPGLLNPEKGVAAHSASRYLGKGIERLNQLARQIRGA
ncbi:hypothetical protein NGA35_10205 [Pseudomonas stutzeri]|nr:hypothetical protein [Stutzerimonas stutzeri]